MDTLLIPTENEFKTWIREAVKEILNIPAVQNDKDAALAQEPLISRKDISLFLTQVAAIPLQMLKFPPYFLKVSMTDFHLFVGGYEYRMLYRTYEGFFYL